jgi:hypothetical protein
LFLTAKNRRKKAGGETNAGGPWRAKTRYSTGRCASFQAKPEDFEAHVGGRGNPEITPPGTVFIRLFR